MTQTETQTQTGFDEVEERFDAIRSSGDEAQLAVYVDGELVVDLAAGIEPTAMMTVFSSTKGLAAITLGLLVDRGLLDLDERVATYWPEFAAASKGTVTVRQLLSHQAGLPTADVPIAEGDWLDDHRAATVLAAQAPLWRPGAGFGYHAVSIGTLMSELCFRITGEPIQAVYEREVRRPADADAYMGLPVELEERVVELQPMASPTPKQREAFAAEFNAQRGPFGPAVFGAGLDVLTSAAGRRFGHPAGGGVASARGLAAVYQWATGYGQGAPGGVSGSTLAAFAQTQVAGYDLVLDQPYRSHGIVFQKPTPALPIGSYRAFGHDGAGGALAFADPVGRICLGYTIRRTPFPGGVDRRLFAIIAAVHRSIA